MKCPRCQNDNPEGTALLRPLRPGTAGTGDLPPPRGRRPFRRHPGASSGARTFARPVRDHRGDGQGRHGTGSYMPYGQQDREIVALQAPQARDRLGLEIIERFRNEIKRPRRSPTGTSAGCMTSARNGSRSYHLHGVRPRRGPQERHTGGSGQSQRGQGPRPEPGRSSKASSRPRPPAASSTATSSPDHHIDRDGNAKIMDFASPARSTPRA